MVDTTLKGGSPQFTVTLQGDGKCFIFENGVRKEALLTPLPLYGQDSWGTDVMDFGGTIKTFLLSGIYIATSKTDAKEWIDDFEGMIQGNQVTGKGYPLTFTDDYRGIKKVKILETPNTVIKGEPVIVRWTLKMLESSEVG